MSRRSPSPKRSAETNFPIKVKIRIPDRGFGTKLGEMHAWLRTNVGHGAYENHADGCNPSGDVTAYYFQSTEIADRFVIELDLELADGTRLAAPHGGADV